MNNKLRHMTVEEQIALLESKGLLFDDKEQAAKHLGMYGYYNIINSYKSPYIFKYNDKTEYLEGTTFEQLFSLFTFDHNLRNSIMSAMLDLEEHIRAVAAEVIAESFGVNHNEYLQWKNYRDRHVTYQRFGLRSILETLQKNLMSDKDPIKYYREQKGIVPPWILFKGTYFSTLVNFTRLFKEAQKQAFVKKLYGCSDDLCASQNVKNLLFDTLFTSLEYRNLAAHGGRVYNYNANYSLQFRYSPELDIITPALSELETKYGMSQLLILLETLLYKNPLEIIKNTITQELKRHLELYPNDYSILGNAFGITVFSKSQDCIVHNGEEYFVDVIRQSDDPSTILITKIPEDLLPLFQSAVKANIESSD